MGSSGPTLVGRHDLMPPHGKEYTMNAYRSYFDRIKVSSTLHRHLLSGGRAEKRRAPALVRYGSMAACLALICLTGFGVWRWSTPHVGGDITVGDSLIPGEKDTYGPGETPPVLAGDEYVLSPEERPIDPAVTLANFEGGTELVARIAMPEGWFEEKLTRAQMVALLGGEEENDAPWYLMWSGYDITGKAIYDGTGKLWRVVLEGVERADDKNSFSMTVRPGALPEDCVVLNEEPTEINGVSVQGIKGQYGITDGAMGESSTLAFMAGEIGVRFTASNRSAENAEYLASLVANCYAGLPNAETLFSLSLEGLDPYEGEIPEWRSEKLTLSEARAEEGLGQYIPDFIPSGFAFENAYRELGQGRDWLSASWYKGYGYISMTVQRPVGEVEVMDVENKTYYDERLYTIPYADSVPDEVMFGGFQNPVFRFVDLTLDVLEARLTYVTGEAGDADGYRGNFSVLYEDGLVAEYRFKGVTPEQVVEILSITGG